MKPLLAVLLLISLLPDITHAATEYATFESFYKESSSIGWTIAAVVALIAGAVIFFTGGTASPIVVTIGSWLGGMMGLSGIAATNAGLAFLGGGSIASGGFGIIGGTALLTAALSFGTEVVFDYTIGKSVSEYKYSNLAELSKNMPTLPLPMNSSGPAAYVNATKILENIDKESPIYSNSNQKVITRAIKTIQTDQESPDPNEVSKNDSLLSLLYFVSNDYIKAKEHADLAITHARASEIRRTLPAFIYATSSLYEKNFNFESVTSNYLRYSVLAEPDNPLIPQLFSIYLDRMLLRFNDNYLDENTLMYIFNIMTSPTLEDVRVENFTILLSRYFIRLKLEQQKISSLVNTLNDTIKNSKKTLTAVNDSLNRYDILIQDSNLVMSNFLSLKLDEDSRLQASDFKMLLTHYMEDRERLASLVDILKKHQETLPQSDNDNWTLYIILIILVIVGLFIAKGAYNKAHYRTK